ncbi:hypothetical protein ACN9MZ_26085 [Pseudoduganella sp. S-14]|uniref:hypothetical protein n=1 Tax=Pseudoduganella sp. S-14 TaxID=3404065 RepID=UPI003CE6A08D
MAWHKIGNSYYSDAEVRAQSANLFQFLLDVGLPGFIAYSGGAALFRALAHYQFFLVHSTTSKLICIMAGFLIFGVVYSLRKMLIVLTFLSFIGLVFLGVSMEFFHWLNT